MLHFKVTVVGWEFLGRDGTIGLGFWGRVFYVGLLCTDLN